MKIWNPIILQEVLKAVVRSTKNLEKINTKIVFIPQIHFKVTCRKLCARHGHIQRLTYQLIAIDVTDYMILTSVARV